MPTTLTGRGQCKLLDGDRTPANDAECAVLPSARLVLALYVRDAHYVHMTGGRLTLPGNRRWWTLASLAGSLVLAVGLGYLWVGRQGYIPVGTVTCTLEGFQDPVPSFEQLVTEYGKSPYCARLVRDETWF